MRTATFLVVLAVACAGAMGAVAANLVVGGRLFERTVVENPYETGLRYDAERRKAAPPSCAISAGRCEQRVAEAIVTLEVTPRPVRAMTDLVFTVAVTRSATPGGGEPPAAEQEGELALSMPGMYMGESRVRLAALGGGVFRGKGLVVRCPSGGRTWTAEVTLRGRDPGVAPLRTAFTFELAE